MRLVDSGLISGTINGGRSVGFGTFQTMQRKARRGRNPQTGETIQIPAKRVPKFMPGKGLKKKVK